MKTMDLTTLLRRMEGRLRQPLQTQQAVRACSVRTCRAGYMPRQTYGQKAPDRGTVQVDGCHHIPPCHTREATYNYPGTHTAQ